MEIKRHRIIVLEWLPKRERHTGKEIYENVISKKSSVELMIEHEYHSTESKEGFIKILNQINDTYKEGEIITIDIETHGSKDGIGISNENELSWNELFDYTRPINIKCGGLLVITLSVCFGISHLLAMEPEGRAPFAGIVASNKSMKPQELCGCFTEFYKFYDNPLYLGDAIHALYKSFEVNGKESPFAFIMAVQWFDEFFKESRISEYAKNKAPLLAEAEGIDVECAKFQIIEDFKDLQEENRSYFNFFRCNWHKRCDYSTFNPRKLLNYT